jgi:hypothetical protein
MRVGDGVLRRRRVRASIRADGARPAERAGARAPSSIHGAAGAGIPR